MRIQARTVAVPACTHEIRNSAKALFFLLCFVMQNAGAQTPGDPGVLYASSGRGGPNPASLFSVDTNTGAATLIGPAGQTSVPAVALDSNGNIFATNGVLSPPTLLIRLDAATGASTPIGTTSSFYIEGLAFDANDVLYGIDASAGTLVTIDTTSGVSSPVGGSFLFNLIGMTYDPDADLFYVSTGGNSSSPGNIYSVNTTTGVRTFVGNTGLGVVSDLAFLDGRLFGLQSPGGGADFNLIEIDPITGFGVNIGPTGFRSMSGLAAIPVLETDLSITKTDGVTSAVPGQDSVTYTIVATNNGPTDDPGVNIADTFPTGLTCSTSAVENGTMGATVGPFAGNINDTLGMPAGSSVTYTVTCSIDQAATGTLSNTATITGSFSDTEPGNNSATDGDTLLTPQSDIAITKTDNVTTAIPGATTLTYEIVVTNNGPSADPSVLIDDNFPADLACNDGEIFPLAAGLNRGDVIIISVDCTIDPGATGTLSNTATATASVTDPNPDNNSATDNDTVLAPEADLVITKSDSPDPVIAGNSLTYTVTVQNNGPSDATGVVVTDTLPAGLSNPVTSGCAEDTSGTPTCTLGTIAASGSAMYTITADVDANVPNGTTISNMASVASATALVNTGDDSVSTDTLVNAEADLVITKSDSADPVTAGTPLTYTITVQNNGPSDAQAVSVADTLPAGLSNSVSAGCSEDPNGTASCSLGTIAAGASAQYTITSDVDADVPDGTTLTNNASASSTTTLVNSGDDSTSEDTGVIARADLSITKTDDPDSVVAGEVLTYTVTVDNAGPSDAQAVSVADTLPAGVSNPVTAGCSEDPNGTPTCSFGTIAAGGSAQYTITVDVDSSTLGLITNTATVSSTTIDPNTGDETAAQGTTVIDVADLSITKLDDGDPVISGAGARLVYTVEVSNAGPSDARNVNVFDDLPPVLLFEETVGCVNDPFGVPSCNLDYIAAGASKSYTIEVEVVRSDQLVTNTVTASTSATDPEGGNDSASQETQLIPIAIPVNNPLALMLLVLMLGGFGWVAVRRT